MRKSVFFLVLLLFGTVLRPGFAEQTSLLLNPPPDGEVQSNDLVVSASVSGPLSEALPLGSAQLFIGGRNVTGLCLRTESYLSYRPLNPLPLGPVEARLEFVNGVVRQWTFDIVPTKLIEEVLHNGADSLGEYQELKVTMKAEPGLEASFSIAEDREEFPMNEVSRGLYEGTYTVKPGDYYLGVPIHAQVHLGSRRERRTADKEANLFGHLFRVHIIEPLPGKAPSNNFLIKGRTRPGSKVSIVPRLSFNQRTRAPSSRWSSGGGGSIESRADEEGFFEIEYGVPISVPNLSVVFSVYAVSPEGERSVPITLRYTF